MSAWIATTLVLAIAAVTDAATADAGSCGPKNRYQCSNNEKSLDLTSVPEITEKIIGKEPVIKGKTKPLNEPAPSAPYTGPIFGMTSGKRAPTVGYSWSLE